jgi:hypothetical protein
MTRTQPFLISSLGAAVFALSFGFCQAAEVGDGQAPAATAKAVVAAADEDLMGSAVLPARLHASAGACELPRHHRHIAAAHRHHLQPTRVAKASNTRPIVVASLSNRPRPEPEAPVVTVAKTPNFNAMLSGIGF